MKTGIVEVADLLSPLSAHGVEKQLMRLPGVKQVEVNPVSGSATVVCDETRIDLPAIKARPGDPPGEAAIGPAAEHAHHPAAPGARAKRQAEAVPMDHMAHDMGHGAGMDMQGMVRDGLNASISGRAREIADAWLATRRALRSRSWMVRSAYSEDAVRERMFDGGSRARVVTCPTASSGRIVKRWRDSGRD